MSPDLILFLVLAVASVSSALAMLLASNSVYSAVFLILNFSTIAVFYLLLSAPFIAMAQITVYAGAIMVLFLFVIMLLGGEEVTSRRELPWQQPLAILLGLILLGQVIYLGVTQGAALPAVGAPVPGFGDPSEIGLTLFTQFLLPFQVVAVLLLVAMVGAIVIVKADVRRPVGGAMRESVVSGNGDHRGKLRDEAVEHEPVTERSGQTETEPQGAQAFTKSVPHKGSEQEP